jgi:hypothetical protein
MAMRNKGYYLIVLVVTLGLFALTGLIFSTVNSAEAAFCLGICPEITAKPSGSGTIYVRSDGNWLASVVESDGTMNTYQDSGSKTISVDCSHGQGIYSVAVQSYSPGVQLGVSMIKDGAVLKSKTTNADYGIVSIAGSCA